jgi:hypothetical protein
LNLWSAIEVNGQGEKSNFQLIERLPLFDQGHCSGQSRQII